MVELAMVLTFSCGSGSIFNTLPRQSGAEGDAFLSIFNHLGVARFAPSQRAEPETKGPSQTLSQLLRPGAGKREPRSFQVGKSFRNEIAPRQGLTRQREFTQAGKEGEERPQSGAPKRGHISRQTHLCSLGKYSWTLLSCHGSEFSALEVPFLSHKC